MRDKKKKNKKNEQGTSTGKADQGKAERTCRDDNRRKGKSAVGYG